MSAEDFSTLAAEPADLLIANILFQPLSELAETFAASLKPGGDLILSGLLSAQEEAIAEIYRPWFELQRATEFDGWIRITGVRRNE